MSGKQIWILAANKKTGKVMLLGASSHWQPKVGDPLLPAPTGQKLRNIAGFKVAKILKGKAAIFLKRISFDKQIPLPSFEYREVRALLKEILEVSKMATEEASEKNSSSP